MGGGAPAPQPDSSAGQELAAALQRNLLHEMQIISLHNELTAVKHENVKLRQQLHATNTAGMSNSDRICALEKQMQELLAASLQQSDMHDSISKLHSRQEELVQRQKVDECHYCYRTVDNCFILRALAERARSRGVKLYLCAVDFEKAFDSVDRPLLWAALQRAGIGGTMLQAIQAMYADVPVCVRTEEGLSGCFQSVLGVKQGCPLSPLLFGIFLDDFEGHIQQLGDAAALPQLAGRTVPPLLFADDMFLLSSSASGLQAQLHALQDYCNAKKLTVNAKKTQVMIMRPGGGSGNGKLAAGESFEYAGLPLEVASSTKYLGLTFSQLSKQHGFASCADVLAKAGRQAMFAMRRRAWELGACLVEQQCMLFDVFVKPVLSYGCELWGVDVLLRPDCSSVERVHRWFCRRVQGLPKQVTAAISLAELGRQPLQSFWIQQLVRFWNRLQNSAADEDRVLGWAFKDNLELMREGGDLAAGSACWSRRWLHVLQSAPPASGTLEWLTELDEAAVIERAAAAYLRNLVLKTESALPAQGITAHVQDLLCQQLNIAVTVLKVQPLGNKQHSDSDSQNRKHAYKVGLGSSGQRTEVLRIKAQALRGTPLSIDALLTPDQLASKQRLMPVARQAKSAGQSVRWRYGTLLINGKPYTGPGSLPTPAEQQQQQQQQQQQAPTNASDGYQTVQRRQRKHAQQHQPAHGSKKSLFPATHQQKDGLAIKPAPNANPKPPPPANGSSKQPAAAPKKAAAADGCAAPSPPSPTRA
ncbi:hypothetical protein D9Q98_005801 [Chlorella vulgaris]|uniref:Reverse transcriptase domain-containing protein n=2 Tax=Chlorella vulgaris TaxID=3077 RepID=A0A9D4TMJ8_CHLVU|nr:hypothetical protein D9Q98_010671 [Chlorella vulgaris]KAI3429716.1 hypothetical protein D9Q98_005801 [Chlorella vulgaris]